MFYDSSNSTEFKAVRLRLSDLLGLMNSTKFDVQFELEFVLHR